MKIPTPRNQGYNGGYGGVGSKPAPRAWTPGRTRRKEGAERKRAPRRFRHLRLRRTRPPRMEPMSSAGMIALTAVVLGLVYLGVRILIGR